MVRVATGLAKCVYRFRNAIYLMAQREIAARYIGSIGGPLWMVGQPLATVLVFWFVFAVGFKANNFSGIPFIVYFLAGYTPWLLATELLISSTHSIVRHSYLVKKTVFPVEVLPLVSLAVATFTHIIVVLMVVLVVWMNGIVIPMTTFQLVYYYAAMAIMLIGLSWGLAAVQVFHRDVGQGIGVVLNLWFWVTPIVWAEDMIPQNIRWLLTYNPMHYIVQGYRESLIYGVPFWQNLQGMGRFWLMASAVFIVGAYVFQRLKPEFAEVV